MTCRWDRPNFITRPFYSSEGIDGGAICSYLWDFSYTSRFLAELEGRKLRPLIKRFVDPKGSLKFVSGKSYVPGPGEYRYDMQDGEFTHEGDNCSFETILTRARITDPALKAVGEIIHDMDLNDGKFGHPETPGIAHVIAGICQTQGSDEARVARGKELFDDIYEQFRRRKP